MKTYYFPINSSSLAHYMGGACIKPAKYIANKPQDIQNKYNSFLLLTNKFGTTECDCCLELMLTDEEEKDLINVGEGWFLYDTKPLPITRINKIYFNNEEQKNRTINNITMSTAFIPTRLIAVQSFDKISSKSIQVPEDCSGIDQTERIDLFDRYLGALALMRIAHEPYMNYSQNYIATLAFFNLIIDKQLKSYTKVIYNENKPYQGIFNKTNKFEQIIPYLNSTITEDVLYEVAKKNSQTINKDKITRKIDIESLKDTWTYTIAVLLSYGVGDESRKMKIDGLISSNFSSLKNDKQEGVALCYGYNRGYSVFAKEYGNVAYKYKLDSLLDYYTIESIYQYVFNGIISSDFPELEKCWPKLQYQDITSKIDYKILDEVIVGKKKAKLFSQEWWNGYYPRFEKAFGRLAKEIFNTLKSFIETELYNEINDDLQDDFNGTLNSYKKRIKDLEEENKQLRINGSNINDVKETFSSPTECVNNMDNEVFINVATKYKQSSLKDLKKKAGKGVTDDTTLEQLLTKLTLLQNNNLFNN